MHIGFTGTQEGMTEAQKAKITELITGYLDMGKLEVHHGDCIGADYDFHVICRKVDEDIKIHIHGPDLAVKRAFCVGDVQYPPAPYLTRNRHIVDASDIMIATPKEAREQLRSGTWSTIRYAKGEFTKLYVILPDGKVSIFNDV